MDNTSKREQIIAFVAQMIRVERQKKKLSMEQLAEKSNLSLQTVKDIELGKRVCQVDTLVSKVSALDLTTESVFSLCNIALKKAPNEINSIYEALGNTEKLYLYEIAKMMFTISKEKQDI